MGLVDQVSKLQEDFKVVLGNFLEVTDPTLEEEVVRRGRTTYSEDLIVNLSVAIHDSIGPHGECENDVVLAIAVLDNMDTLGMEFRFKDG